MPLIVRNKDTGQYIGEKYSGYPKRHEEVRFKKYAKRYKSEGGVGRSIRHVVKNPKYWNAIENHQTPPPGEKQSIVVIPDNYEIIKVKR